MDEHIVLESGNTLQLLGHIVDNNLNNTRWWIDKNNNADWEIIEIIYQKYCFFPKMMNTHLIWSIHKLR